MSMLVFTGLGHTNYVMFLFGSLRVNLDMGKAAYGWMMMRDENIPGTVVRTSTIPEELGRLVYLLTDKTGTTVCVYAHLRLTWCVYVDMGLWCLYILSHI